MFFVVCRELKLTWHDRGNMINLVIKKKTVIEILWPKLRNNIKVVSGHQLDNTCL